MVPCSHEDEILVERIRNGDRVAKTELTRKYYDKIYAFSLRSTRSHDRALDLTQETILRLLSAVLNWDPERGPLEYYIWGIVRNVTFEQRRQFSKEHPVEDSHLESLQDSVGNSSPSPLDQIEKDEMLFFLKACVKELPEKHRRVFELWYAGRTAKDIGSELNISANYVRQLVFRALNRLRDCITKKYNEAKSE